MRPDTVFMLHPVFYNITATNNTKKTKVFVIKKQETYPDNNFTYFSISTNQFGHA